MVEVKICGISTLEAMETALDAGARWVGLVFYRPSPRWVDLKVARRLADAARERARVVALGVDLSDDELTTISQRIKPDYWQAHGAETPARVLEIRDRTGIPVIKAVPISKAEDVKAASFYEKSACFPLYDASPQGSGDLPGGNGRAFNWSFLSDLPKSCYYMLSGGLHAGNVETALKKCSPSILDVSSGVESAPGVKDVRLIREFIAAVRRGENGH